MILESIGCAVFFTGAQKKNSKTLRPMESISLKSSSIQTVHSIELKLSIYVIDHCPTYCINFGEFRINSFFTGAQKGFLYITV